MSFKEEIERRKTFGIISHPDAGKSWIRLVTKISKKILLER